MRAFFSFLLLSFSPVVGFGFFNDDGSPSSVTLPDAPYYDSTNLAVGIGTNTPNANLHVYTSGTPTGLKLQTTGIPIATINFFSFLSGAGQQVYIGYRPVTLSPGGSGPYDRSGFVIKSTTTEGNEPFKFDIADDLYHFGVGARYGTSKLNVAGSVSIGQQIMYSSYTAPTNGLLVGGGITVIATNTFSPGGVLSSAGTTSASSSTIETEIYSSTFPANTFGQNGDSADFLLAGTFAANGNNKRLRVYLGATTIYDSTSQGMNSGEWSLRGTILRTGASSQKCVTTLSTNSLTLFTFNDYATASSDTTSTINLRVTAVGGATNDVVGELFRTEWKPSS
jgi:hypothetical protein